MFEIGQKVVCVKTHSEGVVKEGEIYTVEDFKVNCCKKLVLDVGLKSKYNNGNMVRCRECGSIITHYGGWWIHYSLFKPLDDLYNEELNSELEEIFSKQPFEV